MGWDVVAAASVVDVVVMVTATPLVHHERVRVDPVSRLLDEGGRVHREAGIVDRFHTAAKSLVVLVHDALRVEELRDRVHVRELTKHERALGHLLVGHCENGRAFRELDQLGVDVGHIGADHNRSGKVASDGVLARGRTLLGGGFLLRGSVGGRLRLRDTLQGGVLGDQLERRERKCFLLREEALGTAVILDDHGGPIPLDLRDLASLDRALYRVEVPNFMLSLRRRQPILHALHAVASLPARADV